MAVVIFSASPSGEVQLACVTGRTFELLHLRAVGPQSAAGDSNKRDVDRVRRAREETAEPWSRMRMAVLAGGKKKR